MNSRRPAAEGPPAGHEGVALPLDLPHEHVEVVVVRRVHVVRQLVVQDLPDAQRLAEALTVSSYKPCP
jgi:hypothetical protein